jgi:initiation factor 1A
MVKNFGGKNSKKIGRKYVSSYAKGGNKLRLTQDEDEIYACVSKMLGNGMCHVLCSDNVQRICIIRNKFRGRSKRDNNLTMGTYVIVGKRSWETNCDAANSKCDLIEVYNDNEIKKLKNEVVDIKWNMFKQIESLGLASSVDDNLDDDVFEFANNKYNDVLANEIEKELEMTAEDETFLQDDGDVDVDDI